MFTSLFIFNLATAIENAPVISTQKLAQNHQSETNKLAPIASKPLPTTTSKVGVPYKLILSYCSKVSTDWTYGDGGGQIEPSIYVNSYFINDLKQTNFKFPSDAKTTILKQPKHGEIKPYKRDLSIHSDEKREAFIYNVHRPDFIGMDSAVFDVEFAGKHIKIIEKYYVAPDFDTNDETTLRKYERLCPPKIHRISGSNRLASPLVSR